MINNNLGSAFQFLQEVAEQAELRYSHGNLTERPFKKSAVFPMMHVNLQNVSAGQSASNFTFSVAVMDRVNYLKTENDGLDPTVLYSAIGYTENQNYMHVLQELYVRFMTKLYAINYDNYNQVTFQYPVNGIPFIEEAEDVLAGFTFTITLTVHSPFATDGRC